MTTDLIRVRIAPSPTGYLHVGTARTALFVWLFARKYKGTFILRIEDTDTERSSAEMTQGILDSLKWLGLDWDEGPYLQSEGFERHRTAALKLLDEDKAYYCFCSTELLEQKRKEAAAQKSDYKYDRTCLHLSREEVQRRLDDGQHGAVRFKIPPGPVTFKDAVMGEVTVGSDTIEDFVLLRSNSQPTYHVSVVIDDIDMRVTHIIRGADHISNTPKQILLYRAFQATVPAFAHAPLLLGPDKAKLSKRHGATSVMAYKEQGIVPDALRNFLALLGWAPGNDQEILGTDELIQSFSLEGISKANAVFDPQKLAWFNAQYIQKLPDAKLVEYLKPEFEKAGLWRDEFLAERYAWFCSVLAVLRPRAKTLLEFPPQARMFLLDAVEFDAAAVQKSLGDASIRGHLATLAGRLESLVPFDGPGAEATTKGLAGELGIKPGNLMSACRVALTGQAVSPGLFDVMAILGREKTVARLRSI